MANVPQPPPHPALKLAQRKVRFCSIQSLATESGCKFIANSYCIDYACTINIYCLLQKGKYHYLDRGIVSAQVREKAEEAMKSADISLQHIKGTSLHDS